MEKGLKVIMEGEVDKRGCKYVIRWGEKQLRERKESIYERNLRN